MIGGSVDSSCFTKVGQYQLEIRKLPVEIIGSQRSVCSVVVRSAQVALTYGYIWRRAALHSTVDGDRSMILLQGTAVVALMG